MDGSPRGNNVRKLENPSPRIDGATKSTWVPLGDAWIGIWTAVVTALLVNAISGFRGGIISPVEVAVLFLACALIGTYGRRKSRAETTIARRIDQNDWHDLKYAPEREQVRRDAYRDIQPTAQWLMWTWCACVGVSVGLFVFQAQFESAVDTGFRERVEKRLDEMNMVLGHLQMDHGKGFPVAGGAVSPTVPRSPAGSGLDVHSAQGDEGAIKSVDHLPGN